jgi:gliding motility-associated lipoprotein GldH
MFLVSCSDNLVFTEYKTLKNSTWKSNEKLTFNFTVKDTTQPKNLFIHVRNNKDYAFSNLYLITSLNFANGTKIVDTLQYEMTDEYGAFFRKRIF